MVKDTRQDIINALFSLVQEEPDLAHLTIKDIAKKAGISRQAIYQKHYNNVDDIIQDIHIQIATEARQAIFSITPQSGISPYEIISDDLIPVLYEHREWLKIIYTSSLSSGWFRYILDSYREWITPYINKKSEILCVSEDILIQMTISQIFSLIIAWLTQPVPQPPEIFKKTFLDMIKLSANDYLDESFRVK